MSRIRSLKRRGSENEDVTRLQDYISEALSPLLDNALLNGVLLKNITVASGTNLIEHKLERKPLGFIVVRKRANVSIWDSQDSVKLPNKFFSLESSGAAVIDIIIF